MAPLDGLTAWLRPAPFPLARRHWPSGLPVRFDFSREPFTDYIAVCRDRIAAARANAAWQADPASAADSSPFEFQPETYPKAGALLLHGLSDSPYQMRDLGRWLARERGMLVRGLLLPGHGTVPGDLLRVRWRDWARATRWGLASFRGEAKKLIVVGFSTGAALAIDAALSGEPLDALVLLSPAIGVSRLAGVASWHRALSWALPRAAWLEIHADRDPVRYESLTHNAVQQVHDLVAANSERWPTTPLNGPLFCVQSSDDATVSAEAAAGFFRRHGHPASRMLLYTRQKRDNGYAERFRHVAVEESGSRIPGAPVISFSHLAPPISPDNPRYGVAGSYRNCLHYELNGDATALSTGRDDALFATSPAAAYGEKSLLAPGRVLRRLTWNPHFDGMLKELGEFLDRIGLN